MDEKLAQIYKGKIDRMIQCAQNDLYGESLVLKAEIYHTREPVAWKDRLKGEYKVVAEMEKWGDLWESGWFHLTGEIPEKWKEKSVALRLEMGGEILIFDHRGVPVYGLTNTSIFVENYKKTIFRLPFDSGKIDYYAEVGANGLFGKEEDPDYASKHELGFCRFLRVCVIREEVWNLLNDCYVLRSLLEVFETQPCRRNQLLMSLYEAANVYDFAPENANAAREILAKELAYRAMDSELMTTAVGHAHIDVGWLWPVRESIRKAARTFSSQLANMEKYPDYVFGASQPQLYQFVKENYPGLYAKIKQRVADGRWELQGGMWVEADCNLISGESMVRQFLHGKNFFMDEFGVDVKNLWLPDVFGYSASMPQIMKKAGCDYFLTQKLSWSQFNKFPHNTFLWRGIDGSEVLTHFPPEDSYNSRLYPKALDNARNNFKENHFLSEFLTVFGVGDGGGGPKEEHLEAAKRLANLEGMPKVKFGRADRFFERIAKDRGKLEYWDGDLYLELHRGTFTTQSRTKRGNRKCEQMLIATEFFCSCLPLKDYPSKGLDRLWKILLLNQFHDILPGSSIRLVYERTEREYAEILESCQSLVHAAAQQMMRKSKNRLTVFNSLSHTYTAPVELPPEWCGYAVTDADGNSIPVQSNAGRCFVLCKFQPQSFTVLTRGKKTENSVSMDDSSTLENDFVRYEFSAAGTLDSAFDKTLNREMLGGSANVLTLYTDRPVHYDAWDIDFMYPDAEKYSLSSMKLEKHSAGNVFQSIAFEYEFGSSKIKQKIRLAANSKRLDFITHADWRERHKMLRVSFPTAIKTTEGACDIQYGFIKRPTHCNTSWDFAKFEVAAQRYADLSNADCGAALLNDCKYGYCLRDNVLDLNLLRSTTYPDEEADQGEHTFTYSFLPHAGMLTGSDVMSEAAQLNRPPLVFDGFAGNMEPPVRLIESDGVTVEVLKKAEKRNALVIRLAETKGKYSKVRLKIKDGCLAETDLLEWKRLSIPAMNKGVIEVALQPFELKTFTLES